MYHIFHWDTFDRETVRIGGEVTLEKARAFVRKKYGDRISPQGADQVDIVLDGTVVESFKVK